MGLKCSLLGHSFEPADFERERKEEGSEVVTVVREIERCVRCGEERVVSENTEVTAVVDEDQVDLEDAGDGTGGGAAVDRSGVADAGGSAGSGTGEEFAARDPEEEDTEILTDEEPDREPGAWPDDGWDPADAPAAEREATAGEGNADTGGAAPEPDEDGDGPAAPDEETLSGITVPEGTIVCTECDFSVDADSSYREGDPCPDCGAWLTSERNR